MKRRVKYKQNEVISKCPKCQNNTEFTVISEQVAEDCCEIWAVCKCSFDPTNYNEVGSAYRVESVWGGVDDDDCQDAILNSWNEAIDKIIENKSQTSKA